MRELNQSTIEPPYERPETLASPPPETLPPPPPSPEFLRRRRARLLLIWGLGIVAAGALVFGFFYLRFARMIDDRLADGAFSDTSSIFTRPLNVMVGDSLTPEQVVQRLHHSGYSTAHTSS